jgi:ATP-dependent exoDNAse (exonuclease V) alpha subunit
VAKESLVDRGNFRREFSGLGRLVTNTISGKIGTAYLTKPGRYGSRIVVELEDGQIVEYPSISQFYNVWRLSE